ncbi:MAG: hypothetical protein H0T68_10160 [Gemmatimonadales bacterium]|nr:hypothetical protein [Gemmatimonadales bacterium]
MRSAPGLVVASLLLVGLSSGAGAQQARPYSEGPVVNVSYIRIKPGMFDKYMTYLDTEYKRNMEAQKKAGIILDYAVFSSPQTQEDDWNMVLTVTYKNMAALDSLRDKAEPISVRTLKATPEQLAQANVERGAMRDLVGNRLLRQLMLK